MSFSSIAQSADQEVVKDVAALTASKVPEIGVDGENFDVRTGIYYWEVEDIRIPGPAGFDLTVSRSYNKGPGTAHRHLANWQIEIPRIKLTGLPNGSTWKTAHVFDDIFIDWMPGRRGGYCSHPYSGPSIGSYPYGIDLFSGLTLIIPGHAPKLLLKNSRGTRPGNFNYLTSDNWVVECITIPGSEDQNIQSGFLVIAPDGTKYTLDIFGVVHGSSIMLNTYTAQTAGREEALAGQSDITAYASKVEDKYGNSLEYKYTLSKKLIERFLFHDWEVRGVDDERRKIRQPLLQSIVANDGRKVSFSYTTEDYLPLVDKITVNGRTWQYIYSGNRNYLAYDVNANQRYYLQEVILPEGLKYRFEYNAPQKHSLISNGRYHQIDALRKLVLMSKHVDPKGLSTEYKYTTEKVGKFETVFGNNNYVVQPVSSRIVSGPSIERQTIDFSYTARKVTLSGAIDRRYEYYSGLQSGYLSKVIDFDNAGNELRTTEFVWENGPRLGEDGFENEYWVSSSIQIPTYAGEIPKYLKTKTVDGKFKTTYSNYDMYGNPRVITEEGVFGKKTTLTYFNKTTFATDGKWIVGVLEDEAISSVSAVSVLGKIDRTFDVNGDLESINNYGLKKRFEYYSNGNLKKEIYRQTPEADEISIVYKNYKRGIAQREEYPENIVITRVVDDNGWVKSQTDGENNTTSCAYDGLGRVTITTLPGQTTRIIVWNTPHQSTLSQGGYREITMFDARGNEIRTESYDVNYPDNKRKSVSTYDLLGRLSAKYRPFDSSSRRVDYVAYKYDNLGRITSITDSANQDDSCSLPCVSLPVTTQFYYNGDWNASRAAEDPAVSYGFGVVDTRGYKKVYELGAYGDPDHSFITKVSEQVRNTKDGSVHYIKTHINRDLLGNIKDVSRGGYTRTYNYYIGMPTLLESEVHPEIGTTAYTYDAVGNVRSKKISSSDMIYYEYDKANRLNKIDYPAGTPDVEFGYYKTGTIKFVDNGQTRWDYLYNGVGQPTEEKLQVDAYTFVIGRSYNLLGHLSAITYPNGEVVDYKPDVFGLATRASNFAYDIKYHPNGLVSSFHYGNGHKFEIDINGFGFPEEIRSTKGGDHGMQRAYAYDSEGNIQSINDKLNVNNNIAMNYDGMGRLITATSGAWGSVGSIAYDDAGNISSKKFGSNLQAYSYNTANNQLRNLSGGYSFSYDSHGNVKDNGKNQFIYNSADNLTGVRGSLSIDYKYDGHNRRVYEAKRGGGNSGEYYSVYGVGGKLLHKLDKKTGERRNYIYVGSRLVASNLDCSTQDADNDGLPDCVENEWGLNPNNPSDALGDVDNDGLKNLYEYAFDLNPHSSDSDGDGLSDHYEVSNNVGGFLDGDRDGDGLSDFDEYQAGANPLDADTDNDGIPDGEDSNPTFNAALLIPILHTLMN